VFSQSFARSATRDRYYIRCIHGYVTHTHRPRYLRSLRSLRWVVRCVARVTFVCAFIVARFYIVLYCRYRSLFLLFVYCVVAAVPPYRCVTFRSTFVARYTAVSRVAAFACLPLRSLPRDSFTAFACRVATVHHTLPRSRIRGALIVVARCTPRFLPFYAAAPFYVLRYVCCLPHVACSTPACTAAIFTASLLRVACRCLAFYVWSAAHLLPSLRFAVTYRCREFLCRCVVVPRYCRRCLPLPAFARLLPRSAVCRIVACTVLFFRAHPLPATAGLYLRALPHPPRLLWITCTLPARTARVLRSFTAYLPAHRHTHCCLFCLTLRCCALGYRSHRLHAQRAIDLVYARAAFWRVCTCVYAARIGFARQFCVHCRAVTCTPLTRLVCRTWISTVTLLRTRLDRFTRSSSHARTHSFAVRCARAAFVPRWFLVTRLPHACRTHAPPPTMPPGSVAFSATHRGSVCWTAPAPHSPRTRLRPLRCADAFGSLLVVGLFRRFDRLHTLLPALRFPVTRTVLGTCRCYVTGDLPLRYYGSLFYPVALRFTFTTALGTLLPRVHVAAVVLPPRCDLV